MRLALIGCVVMILAKAVAFAQTNPVPLVNQTLVPASIQPGGKGFVLTVNGTGFASTAVVNWNGKPILTKVESASSLSAKISAAKISKIGTASVTVTNPVPGGGTSNVVYLPIRPAFSRVAMASLNRFQGTGLNVGDFNNDGNLDVVLGQDFPNQVIDVLPGNGEGSFGSLISSPSPFYHQNAILAADFDGDGRLDLAVSDDLSSTCIFMGKGDGTFGHFDPFSSPLIAPNFMAAGDFNGDGKLDLYVGGFDTGGNGPHFVIYLGNGDGTFRATPPVGNPGSDTGAPAVGDFNGDGFLDLASGTGEYINIFLGNGDGTFQPPVSYPGIDGAASVAATDLNGDGNLDLVTYSQYGVVILLGKGDGTFTQGQYLQFHASGDSHSDVKVGDFDGDGRPDVALFFVYAPYFNDVYLLLGNGDGTLQNPLSFGNFGTVFGGLGFGMGDFNGDGRLDLVANSGTLYLQTSVTASPLSFEFGLQKLGTTSAPQTVIFKNLDSSAVKITGIFVAGTDPNDFSETNNCGTRVPAHGSCRIKATFTPQAVGDRSALVNVVYQGAGSPLAVPLYGRGVTTTVALAPSSLSFPGQLVGTASSPQPATLTNTGTQDVNISSISTKGPFTQRNDCLSVLSAGTNCDILVEFVPQGKGIAKGTLSVIDDADGSPQTVSLSGIGTVVAFSPLGVNFGGEKVGRSSPPVPVKLLNKGKTALAIAQIAVTGTNSGDFSQKNNCGQSVPAHGHCTITVTFKPTATGQRSGAVSVTDNGGGSPQTVPLAGTGT